MDEADAIRAHDRLVKFVVMGLRRRYSCYRRIPYGDMMQTGRLGLLIGLRSYDARYGVRPSTWLFPRIRWTIAEHYWVRTLARRHEAMTDALRLDEADLPASRFEGFERVDEADRIDCWRRRLQAALGRISPRRARAVELRYGLDGAAPATLDQVGRVLGVGRERARQITEDARRKLLRLIGPPKDD